MSRDQFGKTSAWLPTRVLILGRTYMHFSANHVELECTGGLLDGSFQMVRLHPVPFRYLQRDRQFHDFQWITVGARPDEKDSRPETLRIDPESIQLGESLASSDVRTRRRYLDCSPHRVASVEELEAKQKTTGQSLGFLCPKRILRCRIEPRPAAEKEEWLSRQKIQRQQQSFLGEEVKPIDFPEVKFVVEWECDDSACNTVHSMGLMDMGLHQLYRRYRARNDGYSKVVQAMERRLSTSDRDVFLFLGNYLNRRYTFGLMGSYEHARATTAQGELF